MLCTTFRNSTLNGRQIDTKSQYIYYWYNMGQIHIDTITPWNWRPWVIRMACEFEKNCGINTCFVSLIFWNPYTKILMLICQKANIQYQTNTNMYEKVLVHVCCLLTTKGLFAFRKSEWGRQIWFASSLWASAWQIYKPLFCRSGRSVYRRSL